MFAILGNANIKLFHATMENQREKELELEILRLRTEYNTLKDKVEELKDFIENASIPLHWVDSSGIIIWANQAELDALGYSKEEYIGLPIANFHVDTHVIDDILYRLTKNETLRNYPARLRRKDGTVRHVLISSNVMMKDGKFIHTRCFIKDITTLKEEEVKREQLLADLEQSEARLKMAIKATHLGTWDWSAKRNEIYLSGECRKIFGIGEDESVSFNRFTSYIHPEDRDQVSELTLLLAKKEYDKKYDIIFRIYRGDDNRLRWVRAQGVSYFNVQNKPVRIVGTLLDITESKLAEEQSAKLAAIIESSYDAIIGLTLDGTVINWNASAERIYGYSANEMIGKSAAILMPDSYIQQLAEIVPMIKNGEHIKHLEAKIRAKSGRLLDMSMTISPILDARGEIMGISKICRDITDQKREEQRKNTFVAVVSHELKTPLTTITSYVQLLLRKYAIEKESYAYQYGSKIEIQAKRMTSMIQDFLSLVRMDEGEIPLHKEHFLLLDLMQEVIADTKLLTQKHTVQLIDCESLMVFADRDKIGQVLINLLSNAVKYSPQGGAITIGCSKMKDGRVKVFVKDTGIGISKADQKRLFQRFYRVENEESQNIAGFGIGLYLVSEILSRHDSKIKVKSEEGKGSTFSFVIPPEATNLM